MAAPYVVPRSMAEWDQQLPFRVEHQLDGYSRTLYFDGICAAKAFAEYHKFHNRPCVVEVRAMPATHRVEFFSALTATFVLRQQPFGDLESAQAFYSESLRELKVNTGVRLIHQETGSTLASWISRAHG